MGGISVKSGFLKKYGTLLLLATGAGIIYQLPYIRETFYVPIQQAMGLTNKQMGLLSSGYATMATVSYLVGGLVADKFSARKLLTFSFIATGLLGLWFSTFPSFNISRLIFILMGVTTIITYWSALVKATRLLGNSSEQGRLFGLQEGLRGLTNALLVFGMTFVYSQFIDNIDGAAAAIRLCSVVVILIGILNWFFIEDTRRVEQSESIGDVFKGLLSALRIPRVWVIVAIVFTAYSIYGIIGYINIYAINIYGLSVEAGSTLGGVRYFIQAFGGIIGGLLADKIGSRIKVIMYGAILLAVSFLGFILLPANTTLLIAVIINFVFGLFFIYVIRSQYFAVIDDAGIPVSMTGRVSGVVASLGYVPDVFMYTMIGYWLDTFAGKTGYNLMFVYAIIMAVGCFLFSLLLKRLVNKSVKAKQKVN